jgi:hypothetical protein
MRAKRVMEPFTTDGIAMGFFTRHTKDMSNKLFIHSRINLKKLFPLVSHAYYTPKNVNIVWCGYGVLIGCFPLRVHKSYSGVLYRKKMANPIIKPKL